MVAPSSTAYLDFLRPYLQQPLRAQRNSYIRLFNAVSGFRRTRHRPSSTLPQATARPIPSEKALQSQPVIVQSRVKELLETKRLYYPRIRHGATRMRIPVFRTKFEHITADSPSQELVVVYGRIQSIRRAGSRLAFLDITHEFEQLQGMCNFGRLDSQDGTIEEFRELFRVLNRGDHVSITGRPIRTPTGELTIEATELPQLLSPSLVPLPNALIDEDTRIQNRHVDLLVNRKPLDTLRLRSAVMKYLRDFLGERGFLEFNTPILAANAGGAVARPFETRATEFSSRELSLRIAPELWLKRLVVGGVDKVFDIGPAFRNEGIDSLHNPEFTVCEFYDAYANLDDLLTMTEALVSGLARYCADQITGTLQSLPPIPLDAYTPKFTRLEFIPALEERLGFRIPPLEGENALSELVSLLTAHNIALGDGVLQSSLPKLLDRLAGTFLESQSTSAPIFITHHPACMSPLAKSFRCPKTGQLVSARAELFARGMELANMYEEENDPFEQRAKLEAQAQAARERAAVASASALAGQADYDGGEEDGPAVVDESYIQALESGLPPTGGWGCGVERLVMLFSGASRISDCLSFGNLRNVVSLSGPAKGSD